MNENCRDFLKDSIRKRVDFSSTAQSRSLAEPPWQKPLPADARTIALPRPGTWKIPGASLEQAIAHRRSRRHYSRAGLSLEELSFLLWATQGLRPTSSSYRNFRTVPSAGCRHALETYIAAFRVESLEKALYRYLPHGHVLVESGRPANLEEQLAMGTFGQSFCASGAATFIWSAVPARMEWRYAEASYKVIALDAGHACQNLYLACEAIGCGTCAVAAYDQERMDELLEVDGDEEFTVYLAPVGKTPERQEEDE
jgi:SagB-type dehydrogenase family enzyme